MSSQSYLSSPFSPPPLDESLTLPELYDWHYTHNRDYPLFVYEDAPGSLQTISMGEGVQGIHRATTFIRERTGITSDSNTDGNSQVIAILAASDTITSFCTLIGALRTGAAVFPISTRNSAPAVAFLLAETKAKYLFVSAERALQDLAYDSDKLCRKYVEVQKMDMPVFEDVFPTKRFDPHFEMAAVGVVVAVFKPRSPAIVPNAVNVIESVIATKCDYIYITPFFLEAWSENIEYINALAKLRAVVFAGGPLDKDAGDRLVRGGVNVYMTYASTQTSIISEFLSKEPPGMEWDYFKLSRACKVHYEDFGNNEFEIVVQTTDRYRPIVINTQVNGVDAYATGDLVSPHPTKRGYYKVVGRTDDQIMHSNGEKTNPGPLERMLNHHPLVEASVIFGRGRFQCGVLIQPVQSASFNSTNTTQLVEFRDAVWPIIEKMNAFAPTHSRIFKEMILVANPAKPFEYTSKGTLRRQPIINEYRQEIDALYDAVAESAQE
ncbi:hypothetical protein EW145_g5919, partial [Phellinidium pouzarii]